MINTLLESKIMAYMAPLLHRVDALSGEVKILKSKPMPPSTMPLEDER